jgi:large subunit ribosomal protein L25
MARKVLTVEPRQITGKKVAQLRNAGVLPANVFGKGLESVALQIDLEQLQTTLKTMTANEVLDLKIAGEAAARPVIISKLQRHPYKGTWLHADFYQVSLREKMKADVPITVVGDSEAINTYNGVLVMGIETVSVEALPLDLPTHFEVDITPLRSLEDTLHVSDIQVSANITVLTDPEVVVLKIASPRIGAEEGEELPTGPAATAEGEEPAAEAEGEEAAAEGGSEAEASSAD